MIAENLHVNEIRNRTIWNAHWLIGWRKSLNQKKEKEKFCVLGRMIEATRYILRVLTHKSFSKGLHQKSRCKKFSPPYGWQLETHRKKCKFCQIKLSNKYGNQTINVCLSTSLVIWIGMAVNSFWVLTRNKHHHDTTAMLLMN